MLGVALVGDNGLNKKSGSFRNLKKAGTTYKNDWVDTTEYVHEGGGGGGGGAEASAPSEKGCGLNPYVKYTFTVELSMVEMKVVF